MPTRKQLIDQVRADQRARSSRDRADNPKSAIVGIGDRDPMTGQYQVLLPDGSVEMGEKQFNSSLPKGSQVLGVPQSTGGWLLDERDVQPIEPIPQTSTGGKVKTLHSRIEGNERVFYLWGDRARPKRIFAITKDSRMLIAKINNLGGDKWIAGLQWESTTEYATNNFVFAAVIYTQVFSDSQVWNKTNAIGQRGSDASLPSRSFVEPTLQYMGYGFWIVNKYPYSDGDTGFIGQPTIYTFYQGEVRTPTVVPVSLTETRTEGLIVPSLFGSKQGHYWYYPSASYSAIREYKFTPNFQIPDDAGFPFSMIYANDLANFIANYSGGGQLNGKRYCTVRNLYSSVYSSTTNRWDIDIYSIAETTTKRSIKTKVTCKLNPSTDFLCSAAYHS